MDLSTVTDQNQLKAMAYDELVKKQFAERNISMIEQRLQQLQSETEAKPEDGKPKE